MLKLPQVLSLLRLLSSISKIYTFSLGIDVSDGFLVREIGSPSPASGLQPVDIDKAVWLIEPRRTTSVQKFSGTLAHPNREDELGLTLIAFAHFIYDTSDKELVLADIQGEFQLFVIIKMLKLRNVADYCFRIPNVC
jgi:hypothetical protein